MKHLYDFTVSVADAILSVEGAVIFGGYVRDKIRHDHVAQQFYEHPSVEENLRDRELSDMYADRTFLPELADRFLYPKDIDCFMKTASMDVLEDKLKAVGLRLIRMKETLAVNDRYAAPESNNNDDPIRLVKGKVKFDFDNVPVLVRVLPSKLKCMSVNVDIVHVNDTLGKEPPFGCVDFFCNALIIDNAKQVRASKHVFEARGRDPYDMVAKHQMVGTIIDDILNKRARMAGDPPRRRVMKMELKGFEIKTMDECYTLSPPINRDEDDMCIICHENFAHKGDGMLKRVCCAAKYHRKCFTKMLKSDHFSNSCPMCRNEFTMLEKEDTLKLFDYVGLWA